MKTLSLILISVLLSSCAVVKRNGYYQTRRYHFGKHIVKESKGKTKRPINHSVGFESEDTNTDLKTVTTLEFPIGFHLDKELLSPSSFSLITNHLTHESRIAFDTIPPDTVISTQAAENFESAKQSPTPLGKYLFIAVLTSLSMVLLIVLIYNLFSIPALAVTRSIGYKAFLVFALTYVITFFIRAYNPNQFSKMQRRILNIIGIVLLAIPIILLLVLSSMSFDGGIW